MKKFLAAAVFSLSATAAHAADSLSVEIGNGTRGVDMWRVGAQWSQHLRWLPAEHWSFYWDTSVGEWQSESGSVTDVGITPTFRHGPEYGLYIDGGIGFHWLSDTKVSPLVELSTRFQFGDHLGIGWRFNHRGDVALRLQHLSNAGIDNPNPGVNFLQLRLRYFLDR